MVLGVGEVCIESGSAGWLRLLHNDHLGGPGARYDTFSAPDMATYCELGGSGAGGGELAPGAG